MDNSIIFAAQFDVTRVNTHGARLDFIKLETFSKDHLAERFEKEKASVIQETQALVKKHFEERYSATRII